MTALQDTIREMRKTVLQEIGKKLRMTDGSLKEAREILDYVDPDGRQYAAAFDWRGREYCIAYRDSAGPVWTLFEPDAAA